jgi:hypothetical protein
MTLAAVAFHGVASSIGAWRRDVRRYACVARAGSGATSLSGVRQPLPSTLFGDALIALCGDRLRGALETAYAPATSSTVEREPRPRVPDARPLSSAGAERMSSSALPAMSNESREWRPLESRDTSARHTSSTRDDVAQHGDAAWKTNANSDDPAPRADAPESLVAQKTARDGIAAARVGEHSRARSSGETQSPLAIALRRLQRVSTSSAPSAVPRTSAPALQSQNDAVALRETSHTDRTRLSQVVRPTEHDRSSPASDGA